MWMSDPTYHILVTLADEDTNSIPSDGGNGAIKGNLTMQVVPSGGQIRNQCMWRHLVARFATKVSGAMWWPNLELMQVEPSTLQLMHASLAI